MDIADIAADLNAALTSGNAQDTESAQAAYAAFVAEGVDIEPVEVEVGDGLSEEDDEILGDPEELDVPGMSVEGVDIDAIADAELQGDA